MKTKEEMIQEMIDNGITLADFIDYIVKINGVIGVGLISFGDGVAEYIKNKIK